MEDAMSDDKHVPKKPKKQTRKRLDTAPIIINHFEPDMERQIKALRIFLGIPAPDGGRHE
jgi:hypothetical protein